MCLPAPKLSDSRLTDCRFTCHYRCRALIRLDCSWDRGSVADHMCVVEHSIETDTNVVRAFCFLGSRLSTLQWFIICSSVMICAIKSGSGYLLFMVFSTSRNYYHMVPKLPLKMSQETGSLYRHSYTLCM